MNFAQQYGDAPVVGTREPKDVKRNGGGRSVVDREKVIKGLACCILRDPDDKMRCSECPYNESDTYCLNRLKMDALALLKAQKPPKNASISSAIECLLHPQDADGSDMAKAIDTAIRAMRSLRDQEPRVMTMEEVKSAIGSDLFLEISGYPDEEPYMTAATLKGVGSKGISVYGNTFDFVRYNLRVYGWRLWTSRPTEEQRKATPWQ